MFVVLVWRTGEQPSLSVMAYVAGARAAAVWPEPQKIYGGLQCLWRLKLNSGKKHAGERVRALSRPPSRHQYKKTKSPGEQELMVKSELSSEVPCVSGVREFEKKTTCTIRSHRLGSDWNGCEFV